MGDLHPGAPARRVGGASRDVKVYSGGTVQWWGTLDTSTEELDRSTDEATVPNPTGPNAAAIVKTIHATVQVNAPPSNAYQVGVWNTVYSPFGPTPNTCDTSIGQGINISVPVYVGGNLCMGQNAVITKPVYVGGYLFFQNKQGNIGTSTSPINSAHVGSYCQVSSMGVGQSLQERAGERSEQDEHLGHRRSDQPERDCLRLRRYHGAEDLLERGCVRSGLRCVHQHAAGRLVHVRLAGAQPSVQHVDHRQRPGQHRCLPGLRHRRRGHEPEPSHDLQPDPCRELLVLHLGRASSRGMRRPESSPSSAPSSSTAASP